MKDHKPSPFGTRARNSARRFAILVFPVIWLAWTPTAVAQQRTIVRACPERAYGTVADRAAIQQAMLAEGVAAVTDAINRAKRHRGPAMGCPQADYGPRLSVSDIAPSQAEILRAWAPYRRRLPDLDLSCPATGRTYAPLGLAAIWAQRLGLFDDRQAIRALAEFYIDQQYTPKRAGGVEAATPGLYAYYYSDGPSACGLEGVARRQTDALCEGAPELCVRYDIGRFAGARFAVKDHKRFPGDRRKPLGDMGGAAFDHGWVTVFMVEAARSEPDLDRRSRYEQSALLAGEWALAQPLVTNHNYTAKNVWALAVLYAWTGRTDFRARLVTSLEANLLPAVLMDRDGDGLVDGSTIRFDRLTSRTAQRPGRIWDGHNALPWYHSMNAWALVEAYAAFRDRGDTRLAARVRPYAMATVDNLAYEVNALGVPAPRGSRMRDYPFSILLASWRIALPENDPKPLWKSAAWRFWNARVFNESAGARGVNIPIYAALATASAFPGYGGR